MLKIRDLTVFSHGVPLLANVSLELKRGEIAIVIGANNAGKSALLRAIAGGFEQFDGEIRIGGYRLGQEQEKARLQLGYLGSPIVSERYLTGLEWLEVVGVSYHVAAETRIQTILKLAEQLNCKDQLYTIIDRLTPAEEQKIGLIASLLPQPSLVVWDEPTQNLDPSAQQEVIHLTRELASQGTSFLIATNNLWVAEQIGERFILMEDGEIKTEGTLAQLRHLSRAPEKDLASIYTHLVDGQ